MFVSKVKKFVSRQCILFAYIQDKRKLETGGMKKHQIFFPFQGSLFNILQRDHRLLPHRYLGATSSLRIGNLEVNMGNLEEMTDETEKKEKRKIRHNISLNGSFICLNKEISLADP